MRNDKYVVYHGMKGNVAEFALYDEGGIIRGVTMSAEDIPEGTEYQDHFWVDIEDGEIVELQFDPEFTAKKKNEYQEAVEMHRQMQEISKQQRDEDDSDER